MRSVDKGKSPEITFKRYRDAEPYLEKRIGPYCSFREMSIRHVPEIEHKEAKSKGGDILLWENFLLSCKYCNTRKGVIVKRGDLHQYLWPDMDDTFHAFNYDGELPKLDTEYLNKKGDDSYQKALNLFELVKLDNRPVLGAKDKRFFARMEARNYAVRSREGWLRMKNQEDRDTYLESIIMTAKSIGFFSVWMCVFADIEVVRSGLINNFAGTKKEYFK